MVSNVIILAGGPSVREYNLRDLEQRGILIAVNGGAMYCKPHIALTMDRLVGELCVPMWRMQGVPEIWIRDGTAKNFSPDGLRVFRHDGDDPTHMTPVSGRLNGSNSGTCALNLAYQMKPKRIFMLGFDMARGAAPLNLPYWFLPYAWNTVGAAKDGKLREWAEEFVLIEEQFKRAGIEVFNVNHRSRIKTFSKMSYEMFKDVARGV